MLRSIDNEQLVQRETAPSRPRSQSNGVVGRPSATLPPEQSRWRTLGKRPEWMHYNRLIALVALVNVALGWQAVSRGRLGADSATTLATLSTFVVVNISVAILIRQQLVVNLLFKIATSAPTSWPLTVRRALGKVYHFGGIHVGGSVVGTLWYAIFLVALVQARLAGLVEANALLVVTALLLAVLVSIIVLALPPLRARHHDLFERSHRFAGWAALLLFWAQTLLFIEMGRGDMGLISAVVTSFPVWMLTLVTVSIALPWLHLRRVAVAIERPSSHVALARFDYGVTPFAGSSSSISRSPLLEWHAFANVPSPDEEGFRLTISRAGDWTGGFIDDMPSHVWVKGIPTAGVGNIDKLFKRVVWIATGSGIGPCLPHLLSQEVPARLVWSTRTPRATYGDGLVDEILAVQPGAIIWDTNELGRPDLVQLAYEAVQDFDAEAVICISNKKLTWQVVYGMESRGIPAYGAIWDS